MKSVFTPDGRLESHVVKLIQDGGFKFIPSISDETGKLPIKGLNCSPIECLSILDRNNYYGSVYFVVLTSELVEMNGRDVLGNYTANKKLSDMPEPILLAVKEAIQFQGHAWSQKVYQLSKASKKLKSK